MRSGKIPPLHIAIPSEEIGGLLGSQSGRGLTKKEQPTQRNRAKRRHHSKKKKKARPQIVKRLNSSKKTTQRGSKGERDNGVLWGHRRGDWIGGLTCGDEGGGLIEGGYSVRP